jgi:hypothetical protein
MHARLGLAGLLLFGLGGQGVRAEATVSLCTPRETVIFDCSLGRKRVSVCGEGGVSGATYRFGAPGRIELSLPEPATRAATVLTANTLSFAGGGGAYLRYRRADFDYVVYTAVGRGWGEKEGVVVERDGRRLAVLRCRGEVRSVLGPDWFDRAGIAPDVAGFDLP